jgi:hypothetical protein
MAKIIDISGERYGRLVVSSLFPERGKFGETQWACRCDCGTEIIATKNMLISDKTKSCGCLHKTQGGHTRTHRLWKRWCVIKERCRNPNNKKFRLYGAVGITLCERWEHFPNFIADLDDTYFEGATLDRKDGTKGYSPDNCRWATPLIQNNNKKTNRVLTYKERSMTMAQWAREIGAPYVALRARFKLGWSVERALSEPFRKFPRK